MGQRERGSTRGSTPIVGGAVERSRGRESRDIEGARGRGVVGWRETHGRGIQKREGVSNSRRR